MAPTRAAEEYSEDSQSATEDTGRKSTRADHPLTYSDISGFAADIKASFSAAITDLKTSLIVLQEKMAATETEGRHRDRAIQRLDRVVTTQSLHFIEVAGTWKTSITEEGEVILGYVAYRNRWTQIR